jgi:hypothetical protein
MKGNFKEGNEPIIAHKRESTKEERGKMMSRRMLK